MIRKLVGLTLIAAIAAVILNEDFRRQVLDALFGAEEEFEYESTTVPADP